MTKAVQSCTLQAGSWIVKLCTMCVATVTFSTVLYSLFILTLPSHCLCSGDWWWYAETRTVGTHCQEGDPENGQTVWSVQTHCHHQQQEGDHTPSLSTLIHTSSISICAYSKLFVSIYWLLTKTSVCRSFKFIFKCFPPHPLHTHTDSTDVSTWGTQELFSLPAS